jgi:hypothetical protein
MKNLFKLGLDYKSVEPHKSNINKLLGVRNAIAHCDVLQVPKSEEVDDYVTAAFSVMSFVQNEVYTALTKGAYRITAPQHLELGAEGIDVEGCKHFHGNLRRPAPVGERRRRGPRARQHHGLTLPLRMSAWCQFQPRATLPFRLSRRI